MRERLQSARNIMLLSLERLSLGIILASLVAFGESMNLDVLDGKQSCVIIVAKKDSTINGNYELITPSSPKELMVVVKGPGILLYKRKGLAEDYFRLDAPEEGEYQLCFLNNDKTAEAKLQKNPMQQEKLSALGEILKGKEIDTKNNDDEDDPDDVDDRGYTSMMAPEMEEGYIDDLDSWYAANFGFKTIGFGLRLGEDIDLDMADGNDITEEDKAMAQFLTEEADALLQTLNAFLDHESNMRGREIIHRASVGQTSSRLIWYTFIEGAVLLAVSWTQLSYIRRFFETKRTL